MYIYLYYILLLLDMANVLNFKGVLSNVWAPRGLADDSLNEGQLIPDCYAEKLPQL